MGRITLPVKFVYGWFRPDDPVTISHGVLLYAPNVIRAVAIMFCIVGIIFSVPYSIEHVNDTRLVVTRLFVVGLACFATLLIALFVERYYKACVLISVLLGITVILATPAYMDGPNMNPHALLAVVFVLGAGFCLGRRGVVIALAWLILNYLILLVVANWEVWPHPASVEVSRVQYENVSAMFFLLLSMIPMVIGYLALVERSINALQKSHADQQQLLQRLIATQESERKHLAHLLHEGPVQDLGALRLAILNNQSPAEMIPVIDSTISELRALSTNLHPAILDLYGLTAALDQLANQRSGAIQVQVDSQRLGDFDPHVGIVLFRIAQEALTNIQKHSNAQHAWILLEQAENNMILEISDDGQGFDVTSALRTTVQTGHLGLATMHELAMSIDGNLKIISTLGKGTSIMISAPSSTSAPSQDSQNGTARDMASERDNRSFV